MIAHVARIVALIAFILLCAVLPFMPGRYDAVALPLSLMAQLFGWVGLLLVPIGVVWMATELRGRTARRTYMFTIIAIVATTIVWLLLSLATMTESLVLGVGAVMAWLLAISRLLPRLQAIRHTTPASRSALPWYLVVVPVAVALAQWMLARPLSESTRDRAIRNAAPMIADIERYRVANGRYPLAVVSVQEDYKPSVIGIRKYQYEQTGDSYNLFFEQPSFLLGVREFVMYNPLDQHRMTSHALDVLQLTPAELRLDQTRGHNALHDAPHPHWKYFLFD